ncbi:MAG: aminopeptidase, partial [bacterium]|nr:aminopeptidase [bacterium]
CLDRYARILVEHAIGLREGQPLFIYCELIHRDFALRVGEAAYSAGAGQVRYRLLDPLETAQLIRRGREEQIALFYVEYQAWLADLLRSRGALLVLDGKSDPQQLPELQREHPQKHLFFAPGIERHRRRIRPSGVRTEALSRSRSGWKAGTCRRGWSFRTRQNSSACWNESGGAQAGSKRHSGGSAPSSTVIRRSARMRRPSSRPGIEAASRTAVTSVRSLAGIASI